MAKILDKHVDIVLVGDSMANVLYGHKNTHKISLDNIIQHTLSVKMGIKNLYLSLICLKVVITAHDQQKKMQKR